MGEADTATIFAPNAALADAAATRVCNEVKGNDFEAAILHGLEVCDQLEGITGGFITRGNLSVKREQFLN